MKLSIILSSLALAFSAQAITVAYDEGYDDASRSLTAVACSDGVNGLITRYGWQTQGQIPTFPYIGGSSTVAGWNSDQCGTCYKLTYNGRSANVLAVDHSAQGFTISKAALNYLTNNNAVQFGRVDAAVEQVAVSECGL